ncbi:MaoC family dehydratase [Cellulomonas sp. DKR-3]|uniref:MaoC family dehydratase n=1 Tax=Cellulomonas fulva TaxID=2835530 RepID=A0ABS5TY72_9CELL|nr:MaoC family dehydratase [Cellulomonas fulva]
MIAAPSVAALPDVVGRSATGHWFTVSQDRIDQFADATADHQWIHVDPVRAAAGPFGATVAHGFLTLSLVPALTDGLLAVEGAAMVVNYGLDKVRFVSPVRAGSRVRATTTVVGVEPTPAGTRVLSDVVVDLEGADKPAVVARTITLVVPAPPPPAGPAR